MSIVELTTAAACGRLLNYCDRSVVVESTYTCLLDLISWQACAVESFWHQLLLQVLWIPMPPHARVTPPCFLHFFFCWGIFVVDIQVVDMSAVLPRNGTPVVGDMLARRTGPHFSVVSIK